MKLDKKNALLTALALAVAAAAVYLRGFPALVHIVFYAVLVPLLSEEAEREKAPPARRRWTDFAWLAVSAPLCLFYLLRAVGTIPGPRPEILEYGSALLLLYVGVRRAAKPTARPLGREAALLAVTAAALAALLAMAAAEIYMT